MRIVEIQYLNLKSGTGDQKVKILPQERVLLCAEHTTQLGMLSDELALRIRRSSTSQNSLEIGLGYTGKESYALLLTTIDLDEWLEKAISIEAQYKRNYKNIIRHVSETDALKDVWQTHSQSQVFHSAGFEDANETAPTFTIDYFTASLACSLLGIIDGNDAFWERFSEEIRMLYIPTDWLTVESAPHRMLNA